MIRFLFLVIIIVITQRECLLRAHDTVGAVLLRKASARTVLVLLHNPTARCHGIPKQFAGEKKKRFSKQCNRAQSCQQVIRCVWVVRLRRTTVIGVLCENCVLINVTTTTTTTLQDDSVARGPKLLSIKNYVIEIMT